MQLGEAEALGMLDHHDGRLGHIDAHFDDGGRHEHGQSRRVLKRAIAASRSGAFHAAMHEIDFRAEHVRFSIAARSSTAARSTFSDSSTSGHTQ